MKETVTVMLENKVIAEFAVAELISTKSSSGSGCSTCGGCTVKRRAEADETPVQSRSAPAGETREARGEGEADADERRRRRRQRRRRGPRPRDGGTAEPT
jgi:hypothetical protein